MLSKSLRLPSLQALFVFEASARLLSFTKAAGEINVTPVAVSRMVGRLEDALGFKLFVREKSGLALTSQGTTLLRAVTSGFNQIGLAIEELKHDQAEGEVVTLSITSGFAALWLLPRSAAFKKQFPSVNLRLQIMPGRLLGPLDGADLGIRLHGQGSEQNPYCLCPEIIIPICSPQYLAEHGPLDAPAVPEAGHTLIHLDPTTCTWDDFFRTTGIAESPVKNTVYYTDPGLSIQGAMVGQGTALGWLLAIATPLNAGTIVPAWRGYIATGNNFVLEFRTSSPSQRVSQVAQWLLAEMREELRAADAVLDGLSRVARRA